MTLKAPFPWFGGKSTVADLVWDRFGNVPNFVEPFFGSGAVLLGRPHEPKTESINDLDGLVANFWRSIQQDPEETAYWADNPVNECDLHARHLWIVERLQVHQTRMMADPDYFDPRMAGYWVYGMCSWIGSGFASGSGPWVKGQDDEGISILESKLPHLGDAGMGILAWFEELADRLRNVRVCCGDWKRVMGDSVTFKHGMTGVFLDPPYADEDRVNLYREDSFTVDREVTEWCQQNGSNPLLRIALCGYEGESHHVLEGSGWSVIPWKAKGGYGSQGEGQGRINSEKERIWFSPACIGNERGLFDDVSA